MKYQVMLMSQTSQTTVNTIMVQKVWKQFIQLTNINVLVKAQVYSCLVHSFYFYGTYQTYYETLMYYIEYFPYS